MSRPITADEEREAFLARCRHLAAYWARQQSKTPQERCDGLAFSILGLIDGIGGGPSLDLVVRPHPDDMAYCKREGEDWHVDGTVVNGGDRYLHDDYCPGSSR